MDAGRTASIGVRPERLHTVALATVADNEAAGNQVNFFPVVMDEGSGGESTWREAQQSSPIAALAGFVEAAREDLLLNPERVAGWRMPIAVIDIYLPKFLVLLLDLHAAMGSLLEISSSSE
jgi:hypothetical protein